MATNADAFAVDRLPLLSHRGNFSGKASALVRSIIKGDWWRTDPSTGFLPDTVERNQQFYINQGPVDVSVLNARPTATPTSLFPGNSGMLGTRVPVGAPFIKPFVSVPIEGKSWKEQYLWHPWVTKTELEFSTIPTRY
jgi:hypothetical protein